MNIVRILVGAIFILSGTILFGLVHLAIAIHAQGYDIVNLFKNLGYTETWIPYIVSIVQMLLGFILIITSREKKEATNEE